MKKHITTILLIIGLLSIAGCQDKHKEDNKPRLTNSNNNVPVP